MWGVFHRTYMPSFVFVRGWLEYFGLRLFGPPFGPLFFWNLWAYFIRNSLRLIDDRRRQKNLRIHLQDKMVSFRHILDPDHLRRLIVKHMRKALPQEHRNLAKDVWDPTLEKPHMPGPPPEFTIEAALPTGWEPYIATLPEQWRKWLGNKKPRYRQYSTNQATGRMAVSKGNAVVESVMFSQQCLVKRPASRHPQQPPVATCITPFLFTPSLVAEHLQQVHDIAVANPVADVVQGVALGNQ